MVLSNDKGLMRGIHAQHTRSRSDGDNVENIHDPDALQAKGAMSASDVVEATSTYGHSLHIPREFLGLCTDNPSTQPGFPIPGQVEHRGGSLLDVDDAVEAADLSEHLLEGDRRIVD